MKHIFWLAALTVAVLSLMPGPYLPPVAFDVWDKAQHAIAFAGLTALGLGAYPNLHPMRLMLALLAYGAAIELAQSITGWRYGDWQDWLADAVGVVAALTAQRMWRCVS